MSRLSSYKATRKEKNAKKARAMQYKQRKAKKKKVRKSLKKITVEQREAIQIAKVERQLKKIKAKNRKARKQEIPDKELIELRKISTAVLTFFDTLTLALLGSNTSFLQKSGSLDPKSFLFVMSMGLYGRSAKSLISITTHLSSTFKIKISPQGLCKRLHQSSSVSFLKLAFEKMLSIQIENNFKNRYAKLFPMFSGIKLEDSTIIELNERLSKDFKGCGGDGCASAVKLHWTWDLFKFQTSSVDIFRGSKCDQSNDHLIWRRIKKFELIIRDLGFFSITAMNNIANKGAYYLSRLQKHVNVYLKEDDVNPVNILDFLSKGTANGAQIDQIVYIGVAKYKTRLVAEKVPEEVVKKRKARHVKKKKNQIPEDYIKWFGYSVFVTNIPTLSSNMILELYKIRWQIELIFKDLKSVAQINIMKGKTKNRILCLIYGKLISVMVMSIIQSYAVSRSENREISMNKLTKWLIEENRLALAVLQESMLELLIEMIRVFKLISKDKRKRQTMFGRIECAMQIEKESEKIAA